MPGTYNEVVSLSVAGRAGAYTTLMAQAVAARPVIVGNPNLPNGGNGGTIGIFAPYTRVTGLDVSWQGAEGDAISVWGETAKDSKGVVRPAVHHVDIEDNLAHDSGCGGVDVGECRLRHDHQATRSTTTATPRRTSAAGSRSTI
ncbi:MAG: hypothetical protein WDN69_12845 [Aliidongia sp.]